MKHAFLPIILLVASCRPPAPQPPPPAPSPQVSVVETVERAKLARQRFEGGTASFLEVLDAERVHLTNEASLAESRKATATHLIRLFKALGGGWNN